MSVFTLIGLLLLMSFVAGVSSALYLLRRFVAKTDRAESSLEPDARSAEREAMRTTLGAALSLRRMALRAAARYMQLDAASLYVDFCQWSSGTSFQPFQISWAMRWIRSRAPRGLSALASRRSSTLR